MLKKLRPIHKIGIVLVSLIILFVLASLLLASQATSIIFNNQISWSSMPRNGGYELSYIKNSKGRKISIWNFPSLVSTKVVLYLHGNAGRLQHFFPYLRQIGEVYSPAYPGYSESEGQPNIEDTLETATLTYDYLVNVKKIKEENIVIFGHSLGGSPATYLAKERPKASKLVLVNTFASMQSLCVRNYSILCGFTSNIFNTKKYAKDVTIPVRQFGYKNDSTVPYEESKILFDAFGKSTDKKFTELEDFTHADPDFSQILLHM